MDLQAFSIKLKELRHNLKLTQKEFVKELSITPATLSAYEKGLSNPSISAITEIATKYKVSVDWLLGLSDDNSNDIDVNNYSDIIKPLIALTKSKKLKHIVKLTHNNDSLEWSITFHGNNSTFAFSNKDKACKTFDNLLQQYSNVLNLYVSKTIDDNIFNAVIEKLEKDFNFNIDLNDEDLPF